MENCKAKGEVSTLTRRIFTDVNQIPTQDWNCVQAERNIYLSIPYLKALQHGMGSKMKFFFVISYITDGTPVMISSFQLVRFKDKRKKYTVHLCKLSYHLTKKLEDALTLNVLVCGNVFSDGENGLLWSNLITPEDAMEEAEQVIEDLKKKEKVNEESSVILFKEFWTKSVTFSDRLKQFSYRHFMIDVNMVLKMHSDWQTFDDYLSSMKTKFRTRAKSILKKSESLELRSLSSDEIVQYQDKIDLLFSNVLEKSDFSVGVMTSETFSLLKEALPQAFKVTGAFYKGELVGFSTSFVNGQILEANYVGIDYELNNELCIYQRILLDYITQGLNLSVAEIHLGRTAELMKSQIGALPENMSLYIKHQKSVPNLLLKPIIESISPSEFELRPPFKSNFN